jgi:hypothetical protein
MFIKRREAQGCNLRPPSIQLLRLRVATNEAEVGRAALVADNHTELGTNGFRTGAKDSPEESDRAVRVAESDRGYSASGSHHDSSAGRMP